MKKKINFILLLLPQLLFAANYYVAVDGNDDRTTVQAQNINTPWATWQKAINAAYPGDTIFVRGGVYYQSGTDNFVTVNPEAWPTAKGRTGTKTNPICFWAYPPDYEIGNHPILDCGNLKESAGTNFSCFGLNAVEYWHIKGITVRNAYQRGATGRRPQGFGATYSRYLKFENCTAHNISARGFYYESGAWNSWDGKPAFPYEGEHNHDTTYFINCDAYDIRDSLNCSSGDGWKCGNYYGGVIYFVGCRAWNFSDDGFDPSGVGKRVFKNCWASSTDKYASLCGGNIEANGFKLSGVDGGQGDHYKSDYAYGEAYNCLAAFCLGCGFANNAEIDYDNNAKFINNTTYRCAHGFFDMPTFKLARGSEYRNNIVYKSTDVTYEQVGIYNPSVYAESNNTWIATQETGYGSWPGWIYNPAFKLKDDDFVSLDFTQIMRPRKPDGSLPDITFMKLKEGSQFIDAGVDVGLPYYGNAPDLGYAEYWGEEQQSSAKNIISFTLPQQTGVTTINTGNYTVSIEVAHGTNITSLAPTISVSAGATINPASGVSRNFTNPVTYTVTAEDASTQTWTVTVTVADEEPEPGEGRWVPAVKDGEFVIRNGKFVVKYVE